MDAKWKYLSKGIELYNEELYWECHEELEHWWLEDQSIERNVPWAIIQVAAALYHVERDNLIGAKTMINKAKEKLERCRKNSLCPEGLDWQKFDDLVQSVEDDYSELKKFKFPEIL